MDHERAALESRYHALLALASDEATSWHGIAGERLTGDWSGYTRREARLTSDKDQARMFGRVLVPHDGRLDTIEGDEKRVEVPGTRPVAAPPAPGPAGAGHDESGGKVVDDEDDAEDDDIEFERALLEKIRLIALGSLPNGSVKVFSLYYKRTEIIRDVSQLKYANLLRIAGPRVKKFVVKPGQDDPDAMSNKFSVRDVVNALGLMGGQRTIGDQTELGIGVWEGRQVEPDGTRAVVLVGKGEAAYWNGDKKLHHVDRPAAKDCLLDFSSEDNQWYEFSQLKKIIDEMDQQKSIAIADQAIELFSRWRWKNESAPEIVAGLVFSTWVQSFWEWRPQVALTGESNSGKSYLWKAMKGIFGKLCLNTSKTSAAGIMQHLGNTSKLILLDEFEQDSHRDAILDMLRASSRGDQVLRGTANQKGTKFQLRHIAWVAAIEAGLQREPDKNRFVGLELIKPPEELQGKLVLPSDAELRLLGQNMLAIAIRSIARAKPLAVALRDTKVQGIDSRIVESYAVPIAMLATIRGFNDQEANDLLEYHLRTLDLNEVEVEHDKYAVLRDIMSSNVYHNRRGLTAGQWLEQHEKSGGAGTEFSESVEALGGVGLKMDCYTDQDVQGGLKSLGLEAGQKCFVVGYKSVQKKLLRDTNWRSIDKYLVRIQGAIRSRRRVGSVRLHCVLIPWDLMQREIIGQEQRQIPEFR